MYLIPLALFMVGKGRGYYLGGGVSDADGNGRSSGRALGRIAIKDVAASSGGVHSSLAVSGEWRLLCAHPAATGIERAR